MSNQVAFVGQRMRQVRERAGYSQGKLAAMLDLSDRAYKNYELGKREPPLSVVAIFAETFDVELNWLVFGEARQSQAHVRTSLAEETSEATYVVSLQSGEPLAPNRYSAFYSYVLTQCMSKGTTPLDEAQAVYTLMKDDDDQRVATPDQTRTDNTLGQKT